MCRVQAIMCARLNLAQIASALSMQAVLWPKVAAHLSTDTSGLLLPLLPPNHAYVAGPRYRFQAVAPATVFVRRLNQPRCVTQPSAEQRIRPAPRSSHG